MCGIIAYTGNQEATPLLIEGLRSLEYRGYDSAGIAVLDGALRMLITKTPGRVEELACRLAPLHIPGTAGIGHTRWATHGGVTEANSHPHTGCNGLVALVHNGIVENYVELRQELAGADHRFASQTDSETVAHLIETYVQNGAMLEEALRLAAGRIKGAGTFVVASTREPGKIAGLRMGNAGGIVVGRAHIGTFMASDLPAILPHTNLIAYLDSGEIAIIRPGSVEFTDLEGRPVEKEMTRSTLSAASAERGAYPHFMLKEIHEQAESLASAMRGRIDFEAATVALPELPFSVDELRAISRVVIVGMGTSLHAAMIGAHSIETRARLPAQAENASEFRYRDAVIDSSSLVIAVTQSGETADTLAAMEAVSAQGAKLIAVCEVEGSQATRMARGTLLIRAGQEIGVAATKTMSNTVLVLQLLSLFLGRARGTLSNADAQSAIQELAGLPGNVGALLEEEETYRALAGRLATKQHLLYLGRGAMYPAALEGALKMKEISYIHAEGYSAGEMKHGVNALISEAMPTVALAPAGPLYGKMVSNVNEVKARGGEVIAVVTEGDSVLRDIADDVIYMPPASEETSAILSLVPMQLLAYHTAIELGHDPDKPRNLAKTVTVE